MLVLPFNSRERVMRAMPSWSAAWVMLSPRAGNGVLAVNVSPLFLYIYAKSGGYGGYLVILT